MKFYATKTSFGLEPTHSLLDDKHNSKQFDKRGYYFIATRQT